MGCKQSTHVREYEHRGRRNTIIRASSVQSKSTTFEAKQVETANKDTEEASTPKMQEEAPALAFVDTDEIKAMAQEDVDAGTTLGTSVGEEAVEEEKEQIKEQVEEIVNGIFEQLIVDAVNEAGGQFEKQDEEKEKVEEEAPIEAIEEVDIEEEQSIVEANEEAEEEDDIEVDEFNIEIQKLPVEDTPHRELTPEEEETKEEETNPKPVEKAEVKKVSVETPVQEEEIESLEGINDEVDESTVAVKNEVFTASDVSNTEETQEPASKNEQSAVEVQEEAQRLALEDLEEEEKVHELQNHHHHQGGYRGSIALSDLSLEENNTFVATAIVDELDHALQNLNEETPAPPLSAQVPFPLSALEGQVQSQSKVRSLNNPFASSNQKVGMNFPPPPPQQQQFYTNATGGSYPPSVGTTAVRSAPRSSVNKFYVEQTCYEKGYVTYIIQLTIGGEKAWRRPLKKRYNDFKELQKDLISFAPGIEKEIPKLPNANLRTIWRGRTDKATIKKRAARFEQILYFVANHDVLLNSPVFQAFIEH